MNSPGPVSYEMSRRNAAGVRVLDLSPSPGVARLFRAPSRVCEGGGALVPTHSEVACGDRVDVVMAVRGGRPLVVSGVVRELVGQDSGRGQWAHLVFAKSHAHRVRRLMEVASTPAPRGAPPPSSSASTTLRIRGSADLLDVIELAPGRNAAGTVELGWRGARHPGQQVQVEISFGPLADEIVLAGVVLDVRHDSRRSIPVAQIQVAAAHRHRLRYVVDVLRGIRSASTRAHRRVDVKIPGRWWSGAFEQSQLFGELSRAGAFVRTKRLPAVGAALPLQFESEQTGILRVPAQVVWVSEDPGRAGFGARFKVGSREIADRINKMLEAEAASSLAWA